MAEQYVRETVPDADLQEFLIYLVNDYLFRLHRSEKRAERSAITKKQKEERLANTKLAKHIIDKVIQQNQVNINFKDCKASVSKVSDGCLLNLGISTVIKDKMCKVPELVIDNKTIQIGDERLVQCVNDALDLQ